MLKSTLTVIPATTCQTFVLLKPKAVRQKWMSLSQISDRFVVSSTSVAVAEVVSGGCWEFDVRLASYLSLALPATHCPSTTKAFPAIVLLGAVFFQHVKHKPAKYFFFPFRLSEVWKDCLEKTVERKKTSRSPRAPTDLTNVQIRAK